MVWRGYLKSLCKIWKVSIRLTLKQSFYEMRWESQAHPEGGRCRRNRCCLLDSFCLNDPQQLLWQDQGVTKWGSFCSFPLIEGKIDVNITPKCIFYVAVTMALAPTKRRPSLVISSTTWQTTQEQPFHLTVWRYLGANSHCGPHEYIMDHLDFFRNGTANTWSQQLQKLICTVAISETLWPMLVK